MENGITAKTMALEPDIKPFHPVRQIEKNSRRYTAIDAQPPQTPPIKTSDMIGK
jgi:hypothetical protein